MTEPQKRYMEILAQLLPTGSGPERDKLLGEADRLYWSFTDAEQDEVEAAAIETDDKTGKSA